MASLPEFQVHVESVGGDVEVYFCRTQPTLVARFIVSDSDKEETQLFVKFVPTNGLATRVGRPNFVPINRLVAIVEVEEGVV